VPEPYLATPCKIHWVDVCESTQTLGFEQLRLGNLGPNWILARRQTAGIGQRGRQWFDGEGNLMGSRFSVLPHNYDCIGSLAFGFGAIVAQSLSKWVGKDHSINVKWPNDVLIDGAKIAGVLIQTEFLENKKLGLVVGLGLNIASSPELTAGRSTYLKQFLLIDNIDVASVISEIESIINNSHFFEMFIDSSEGHCVDFHKWIELMWSEWGYGRYQNVKLRANNEDMSGRLIGIAQQGQLIFKDQRGYQHLLTQSLIEYD
jgi:BirA family biotin operon repressor/biotin-[acetyl-CoA-carboxylase] ligase